MGPGPGGRLHAGAQAGRADPVDRPVPGPPGPRGRFPRRRDQRRARRWPHYGRGPGAASRAWTNRLHRRIPHGTAHHGRRRPDAQTAVLRAGRQESQHRLRRRRFGRGRGRLALRPVLQSRPVLLCRQPAVRRGQGLRSSRRRAGQRNRAIVWATPSIRRRNRGRRSTGPSSTRSCIHPAGPG